MISFVIKSIYYIGPTIDTVLSLNETYIYTILLNELGLNPNVVIIIMVFL